MKSLATLKKSNLRSLKSMVLVFCFFLTCQQAFCEISFKVEPMLPKQGETVSLKVTKIQNNKSFPKVFFNKTKIPVFELNEAYRAFIPLVANQKPGKYELNIFYGNESKTLELIVSESKFLVEDLTLTKEVASLMATQAELNSIRKTLSTVTSEKKWDTKFIFPSNGHESTQYGVQRRINGSLDPEYFHKGLDFASPEGSPVKACQNGKVILSGFQSMGFVVNGNSVFIDHGHGVISGYLHLKEILVKQEDQVKKGQLIGKIGSTGIATGPHLHFGLYVLGKPVEPKWWINMLVD